MTKLLGLLESLQNLLNIEPIFNKFSKNSNKVNLFLFANNLYFSVDLKKYQLRASVHADKYTFSGSSAELRASNVKVPDSLQMHVFRTYSIGPPAALYCF